MAVLAGAYSLALAKRNDVPYSSECQSRVFRHHHVTPIFGLLVRR
jgi:hypothetical protein